MPDLDLITTVTNSSSMKYPVIVFDSGSPDAGASIDETSRGFQLSYRIIGEWNVLQCDDILQQSFKQRKWITVHACVRHQFSDAEKLAYEELLWSCFIDLLVSMWTSALWI